MKEDKKVKDVFDYLKVTFGYGLGMIFAGGSQYIAGYTVIKGMLEGFIFMSVTYWIVRFIKHKFLTNEED